MSLYSAFDQTKHLEELATPLQGTSVGAISATARRNAVLTNMLGTSATMADLAALVAVSDELAAQSGALAAALATGAGAGTLACMAAYGSSVSKIGDIYRTSILVDLTGASSATSDLDIIGLSTGVAHLGQVTAAECGTIVAGRMTCLEVPASLTDIDLYSATLGTGVFEDNVASTLVETALITAGGAWTAALTKIFTGVPPADDFIYIVNGAADTADPFTAGIFLIEMFGV